MFEREIQFIYDFNYNKVKKLGSFITYEQLQHSEIHPSILQYISGEIDFLIFEDRQKLLKDSLFDYSGENISNYFSSISDEIKKTKRFSQNYIDKLILHATSFTIHYLSRPNWSMLKFIFDDEKSKSILEVKQLFNYFYYYPFLKKVMLSYFDKKNIKSISYDELNALLLKVDGIGLESNYSKVVEDALNAMAEFYNVGMSNRKYIPVSAVELYLKEKNLTPFITKMDEEFINPEVTRYDISDYKNAFSGIIIEFSENVEEKREAVESLEFEEEKETEKLSSFDPFGEESIESEFDESATGIDNVGELHSDEIAEDQLLENEPDELVEEDLQIDGQLLEEENGSNVKEEENTEEPEIELSDEDSLEIDIAEDERIDGDSLQEGLEYIKEEKEINKLKRDNIELTDEAANQSIDESEEDNLVFEDELEELEEEKGTPKLASELLDKELDDAKALYLEEAETDPMKNIDDVFSEEPDNITIELDDDDEDLETKESSPSEVLDEAILSLEKSLDEIITEPAEPIIPPKLVEDDFIEDNLLSDNEIVESESNDESEEMLNSDSIESEYGSVRTVEPELSEQEIDELLRSEDIGDSEIDEPYLHESFENDQVEEIENQEDDGLKPDKEIDEFESLNDFLQQDDEPNELNDSEELEVLATTEQDTNESHLDSVVDEVKTKEEELKLFDEEEVDEIQTNLENKDENQYVTDELAKDEDTIEEEFEENIETSLETDSSELNHIEEPIQFNQPIEAEDAVGSIDLTELLENKKMNKIVESVFDYDMEDFANAIEKIAEARNKDDALLTVEKICETAQVGSTSKEAKLFKSIIADYFDQ